MPEYTRPALDFDVLNAEIETFITKVRGQHPNTKQLLTIISQLLVENAQLTTECNDHRAARGFEPLRQKK